MPEYLSPGVYVEEIDRGPKPIEGVGTAMAVFIGFTEKAQTVERVNGETVTRDLLNKPQLITNWSQFVEKFGGFVSGAYLPHAVYGYFSNGGTRCYVLSVKTIPKAQAALLNNEGKPMLIAQARQAGFDGARLRVKVETTGAPPVEKRGRAAKESPAPEGQPADAPAPGAPVGDGSAAFHLTIERERRGGGWKTEEVIRNATLVEVEENGVRRVAVSYANNKRPTLIDLLIADESAPLAKVWPREQQQSLSIDTRQLAPATSSDFQGDVTERTGIEALEAIDDITMVVVPDLMTTLPGQSLDLNMVKAVQTAIIAHCERMGDRVAILDTPPGLNPQQVKAWRMEATGFDSSYAAMYYPWIEVMDPVTNQPIHVPPSGHIAGIWARSDNTRGVHKAPANEVVRGATGLAYNCTKGEQDVLNPNGVNCIRAFPGMGIRVWGARTLSSNPAWRYINVRRLFNYVEKSIERGTQWVVFEPNEPRLWAKVRRDVSAFLTTVWRGGALFGLTPAEAFYVKCDAELNPPESRDLGRLVIEIGMAPVKPAEFVIFRVSQWQPGAEA
ncbi:MAG: phage tail protein [Candidatus Thermofonsia Clade 3 bacterium]|uniref:Phage tail protein n=1 Tax=Candidatus Thermofonsia Clade 3 bacterium TaxID=2364212 RepID=A0A2M8QAU5_9CHLR|nr:phage tail sheath subtilisin-like domain-containing protein [Candidatus Roseilinea sp. NK_OTU-006]PJF46928.1 MAG: phage tail protein [Candidatus Thermofonsia Clade 3 bacterium]